MIVPRFLRGFAVAAAAFSFVVLTGGSSSAQTARVQVIHNAADPAVQWLDLYLNDALIADSLLFRLATPYLEVPSGSGIEAGLAPLNSAGPKDIFKRIPISLEENRQYILVIGGVLDPGSFKKNPDGASTELTILVRETKNDADANGTSDYLFVNGATDASGLSFFPGTSSPLAEDVGYGTSSDYVSFDDFVYTMGVAPTTATARLLGFFDLDVGFLQNKAFTILTSGFLDRVGNGNGPELKLMIVADDGFFRSVETISVPEDFATMQIINNSADVDHPNGFDILFDGGLAIDNLIFRGATASFGVPSGLNLRIQVADSSGSQIYATSVIASEAGTNYLVMISGLVTPGEYAPNPDGRPTGLSMAINPNIRSGPDGLGVGEFVFSNGLTDATTIDLEITDVDPIVALPLGEMTGYRSMANFDPLMEIFRNDSPLPPLVSHIVSIPFVLGSSFVMYTSGFDNPDLNKNGSSAELMLALKNGTVVQLKARETLLPFSRLQLIHASADPSLQLVDLYINQFIVGDDTEFRSGTPFVDVFTGKTVTVGIAPPSSTDFREIVRSARIVFDEATMASAVVRGLLNAAAFAPNPDGLDTGLDVHVIRDALEQGPDASQVTILVTTEITDAPTMNAMLDTSVPFATNLAFSEAGSYGLISAARHSFDFRDVATDNRVAKSFVEFFGLRGRAGILVASGFVDTTDANQNGPAFSSFLVLDDGTTRRYDQIFTSIESAPDDLPSEMTLRGAYPNPFSTEASVLFDLPEPATVSLQLFDVTGRRVGQVDPQLVAAGRGRTLKLVVPGLSSGMYFYRLTASGASGSQSAQGELMLVH